MIHGTQSLWNAARDHYAAHGCAIISITWGNPPHIEAYLKAGTTPPALPPEMPAGTTVKFHEPNRVFLQSPGSGV